MEVRLKGFKQFKFRPVIAGSGFADGKREPWAKEYRQPLKAENSPWLTARKKPGISVL